MIDQLSRGLFKGQGQSNDGANPSTPDAFSFTTKNQTITVSTTTTTTIIERKVYVRSECNTCVLYYKQGMGVLKDGF